MRATFKDTSFLFVVALSLALRVVLVIVLQNEQYSDSVWYRGAAWRLASVGEFGPEGPSAWLCPGYPFFLAAVFKIFGYSDLAGKLANALLGCAACGFTYQLGRSFFGPKVGLIAGVILAIWPSHLFHTAILSVEPLLTLLFVLCFWVGTRPIPAGRAYWIWAVGLGILVGFSGLVRPTAGTLLLALGLYLWQQSQSLKRAIILLITPAFLAAVVLGSWTVRNYVRFGEVILVATSGGYNFWQVNHRFATGNGSFWATLPPEVREEPEYKIMHDGDEFTKNREGYAYGKRFLRQHPEHIFKMAPAKIRWIYFTDTSSLYEAVLYAPESYPGWFAGWVKEHARLAESFTFRFYQVIMLMAVAAVVVARSEVRWRMLPFLALPFLVTSFHFMVHAKDRFHVPLEPIFALLAAIFMIELFQRLGWVKSQESA